MIKQIESLFGNGNNLTDQEEDKLLDYIDGESMEQVLSGLLLGDETGVTEEVEKEFEELLSEKYQDSNGFSVWCSFDYVVINKRLGYLIILHSFADVIYDYEGYHEYENYEVTDVKYYSYTDELVKFLDEYNKEQEKIKKERSEELEVYREKSRKMEQERKKREKKKKDKIRVCRGKLIDQLGESGFTQLKSLKGNLISQFEKVFYVYDWKVYNKLDDVIKEYEKSTERELNNVVKVQVRELTRRTVRLQVGQDGVLKVIKKRTSKSMLNEALKYVDFINEKYGYESTVFSKKYIKGDLEKEYTFNSYVSYLLEEERQRKIREMESLGKVLSMFR